jgi:hypothetical protein
MTNQSTLAAVLSTARVRFISALVVVALLLGIATEGISITSAYYNLRKVRCDAALSAIEAGTKGSTRDDHHTDKVQVFVHDCLQ